MKGIFQIILGLLFIVLALIALTYNSWLVATINLVQGGIVIFLILIGIVTILLGFAEVKG